MCVGIYITNVLINIFISFQGEPSPTTGSFFKPQMMQGSSGGSMTFPSVINSSNPLDGTQSSGFEFKPNPGSYSLGGFSFSGSLVNSRSNWSFSLLDVNAIIFSVHSMPCLSFEFYSYFL